MRSENMYKSLLTTYHMTDILSPLQEIVVVEHDGDNRFYTGSRIHAISAHAH